MQPAVQQPWETPAAPGNSNSLGVCNSTQLISVVKRQQQLATCAASMYLSSFFSCCTSMDSFKQAVLLVTWCGHPGTTSTTWPARNDVGISV
jgi:hypothetical protein